MPSRVYFDGNPWPDGHAIVAAAFGLQIAEDEHTDELTLWARLSFTTERYAESGPGIQGTTDWASPLVWQNYQQCTMRSDEELPLGTARNPAELGGAFELRADHFDGDLARKKLAFRPYLLGHDAASHHVIRFSPHGPLSFTIDWTGRIALTYAGDYTPRYTFRAHLTDVPLANVTTFHAQTLTDATDQLRTLTRGLPEGTRLAPHPKSPSGHIRWWTLSL